MNRGYSIAVTVVGLALVLAASLSWAGPPNNDVSDANRNTAGGTNALKNNTTGTDNTAFGDGALQFNTSSSASFNSAFGSAALHDNTSGSSNTAIGLNALGKNTDGLANTASGFNALRNNTHGQDNTASGTGALFNNTEGKRNTACGFNTLVTNTNGSYQTAVGGFALQNNFIGSSNTAVGDTALQKNTTGSMNIALGAQAGSNLTSGSNNIYIGNTGATTEDHTLRVGTGLKAAFISGIFGTTATGASAVFINSSGQLGTKSSAARYKRDIVTMGARSRGLFQLRPVTFRYKQDPERVRQYGLIAEEVAQIYPELVVRDAHGVVEAVQYEELIPMLLNELQHQRQELGGQERQLTAQSKQLAEVKAQNERLQASFLKQQERDEARNAALTARLAQLEELTRAATMASR